MKIERNTHFNRVVRKYSIRMTSLFLSTLLLLNAVPVVVAAEDTQTDDVEYLETPENEIEETEELHEFMEASIYENQSGEEADSSEMTTRVMTVNELEQISGDTNLDTQEDEVGEETLLEEDPELEGVDEPGTPEIPEESIPEPQPEPTPDPEPEPTPEPIPDPQPEENTDSQPEENTDPVPRPTVNPVLEPNPIVANASTITGQATPGANVIVIYPNSSRQRSATVNSDGSWLIRNIGGDSTYLVEGATVPMQLLVVEGETVFEYDYLFTVGDNTATDLIEESQTEFIPASTSVPDQVQTSEQPAEPVATNQGDGESVTHSEELEMLPETGEAANVSMLGFASLAAGFGLMTIGKRQRETK